MSKQVPDETVPDPKEPFLEIIRKWKFHWMDKESGYFQRAFSIDSNMMHDLARRLAEKERDEARNQLAETRKDMLIIEDLRADNANRADDAQDRLKVAEKWLGKIAHCFVLGCWCSYHHESQMAKHALAAIRAEDNFQCLGSSEVERRSHTPGVAGSSPAPDTKEQSCHVDAPTGRPLRQCPRCGGSRSVLTPMTDRNGNSAGNWWRCDTCTIDEKDETTPLVVDAPSDSTALEDMLKTTKVGDRARIRALVASYQIEAEFYLGKLNELWGITMPSRRGHYRRNLGGEVLNLVAYATGYRERLKVGAMALASTAKTSTKGEK